MSISLIMNICFALIEKQKKNKYARELKCFPLIEDSLTEYPDFYYLQQAI